MASRFGADITLDPTVVDVPAEIRRLTHGAGDIAIEALGTQGTFEGCLRRLPEGQPR